MIKPHPTTVLMYHAVSAVGDGFSRADAHYSVDPARFLEQLQLVRDAGRRPQSVQSLLLRPEASAVAFTFDDGDVSNAWAAQALHDAGGSGDFFVNTQTVGKAGHLSWQALRDMTAAGMSIQSHAHSHRYLDELPPAEVEQELHTSKAMLEDKLGCPVELFAPPGGRMPAGMHLTTTRLGYKAICSSRVALWRDLRSDDIPRLAVLRGTTPAQFSKWLAQDRLELLRQRLRHGALTSSKQLLGNTNYERVRRGLLRLASGGR
ncbi:polysaccharide deacetylase family protein [Thiomonas sp.]